MYMKYETILHKIIHRSISHNPHQTTQTTTHHNLPTEPTKPQPTNSLRINPKAIPFASCPSSSLTAIPDQTLLLRVKEVNDCLQDTAGDLSLDEQDEVVDDRGHGVEVHFLEDALYFAYHFLKLLLRQVHVSVRFGLYDFFNLGGFLFHYNHCFSKA